MSKLTALIVIPIALLGVKRLQETTKEETPEETIKPLIPEYVVDDVRPGEIGPSGRLKL